MEIDDFGNLCMGCMKDKGQSLTCPACGYRPDERRSPFVLPYQAVLNNKFLVGRILGRPGGFGVTYLAWDLVLHTTVAIKEYLPRDLVARDPNQMTVTPHTQDAGEEFAYGLKQFLREARTLCKFNHPNVVRVREFFEQNHTAYLAMDYYEGISLDEYFKRNGGRLSETQVMNIMLPILDGLREVHAQGFLHRDIKPDNIYLTKHGTPILLDFGAARQALWGQLSRSLSVVLTPGFAPFEQYLEHQEFGPPVDIYAVGATFYYLATGQKPQEATARYRKDTLASPDSLMPALSQHFGRAVMRALALEPENRPQSIDELRHLLLPLETAPPPALPEPVTVSGSARHELLATPTENDPATTSTAHARSHPTATLHLKCAHCKATNAVPTNADLRRYACARCGKPLARMPRRQEAPLWLWGLLGAVLVVGGMVLSTRMEYARGFVDPLSSAEKAPTGGFETVENETPAPGAADPDFSPPPATIDPEPSPAEASPDAADEQPRPDTRPTGFEQPHPPAPHQPPQFSIDACRNKTPGASCTDGFRLWGFCQQVEAWFACIPDGPPPPGFGGTHHGPRP